MDLQHARQIASSDTAHPCSILCFSVQAAEAALAALKGTCSKLVSDAATLSDKLSSERSYSHDLEQQLHSASTAVSSQQARARQAMSVMRQAQAQHQLSAERLGAAESECKRLAKVATSEAEAAASAKAHSQAQAERAERLQVQLATCEARAAELQQMVDGLQQRMQVREFQCR
jgi:chromosome segregation ATPase